MKYLLLFVFVLGCTSGPSYAYEEPVTPESCDLQEEDIDGLLVDLDDLREELRLKDERLVGMSKQIHNILNCDLASSSTLESGEECGSEYRE